MLLLGTTKAVTSVTSSTSLTTDLEAPALLLLTTFVLFLSSALIKLSFQPVAPPMRVWPAAQAAPALPQPVWSAPWLQLPPTAEAWQQVATHPATQELWSAAEGRPLSAAAFRTAARLFAPLAQRVLDALEEEGSDADRLGEGKGVRVRKQETGGKRMLGTAGTAG